MKILVCGSRDLGDIGLVFNTLNSIHEKTPITFLVNGGANGADYLSTLWAQALDVEYKEYEADWDQYGKSAGPIRNATMLRENPDTKLVLAFPGGRGTEDMVSKAEEAKIEVIRV